ncbi:MAG TPA: HAD hydrolase-like protein [Planctomycetota bacterium]
MPPPICFDAVVFDLDGTLIATDRFWIESAERGARRALAELGLERALPRPEQWLALVGLPLDVGFRSLFPDLSEGARLAVLRACVEEEHALLARSGVPAMEGARELVQDLAERGLSLGIASNCQQDYLDHMLDGLGLRERVRGAYCRESQGIASKADMLARLLADFGTRSAVMVGDRASDRDAAWENGLPHVHCAFGFAQGDEAVEAEGRIQALAELGPLLERRGRWIERALARLGAFSRAGFRLGVSGGPGAGKTLFARDAARLVGARGRPAVAVALESFARPVPEVPGDLPRDALEARIDLERLARELLQPHEAGREVPLAVPGLGGETSVPAGALLVLEGAELLGAKLRTGLDRLIHLDLPENVAWRRLAGRARGPEGGERLAVPPSAREALARQRVLERRYPPRVAADLVLDGTNPLGSAARAPEGARGGLGADPPGR